MFFFLNGTIQAVLFVYLFLFNSPSYSDLANKNGVA